MQDSRVRKLGSAVFAICSFKESLTRPIIEDSFFLVREVPEAIRKATEEAKKSLIRVPLRESRTLHHDGYGRWGAVKNQMRAAPPGHSRHAGCKPQSNKHITGNCNSI